LLPGWRSGAVTWSAVRRKTSGTPAERLDPAFRKVLTVPNYAILKHDEEEKQRLAEGEGREEATLGTSVLFTATDKRLSCGIHPFALCFALLKQFRKIGGTRGHFRESPNGLRIRHHRRIPAV